MSKTTFYLGAKFSLKRARNRSLKSKRGNRYQKKNLRPVNRVQSAPSPSGFYSTPRRPVIRNRCVIAPTHSPVILAVVMSPYHRGGSTRHSDDTMDDETDDKDDTKRKSRNLSEKKRRDQFNMLVNELGSMVSTNTRKMDKSTVLRSTISFLKNHNEIAVRSRAHEIQEDWKPPFLSNEEFTHLILEALDGFIMVFSSTGRIYYASQSVTSLLGHFPNDLVNTSIYEIAHQDDHTLIYNVLASSANAQDQGDPNNDNQVSFTCHIRIGGLDFQDEPEYELVQFMGYFRSDVNVDLDTDNLFLNDRLDGGSSNDTKIVFVGTGRLKTPQLIREMSVVDGAKSEFTSRHSLEWKFLFLDHRAPPIIGYLPIEVLGTSGYDYYHVDDLDKIIAHHKALMQKGEGTSCYYRFLTKGQQWIWLQTRYYITYNQWNSKPEFVVCTHRVISYADVMKQSKKSPGESKKSSQDIDVSKSPIDNQQRQPAARSESGLSLSPWSPRSPKTSWSHLVAVTTRSHHQGGPGSDTTSVSAGSHSSKYSHQVRVQSGRPKVDSHSTATGSRGGKLPAEPTNVNQACVAFLEPSQYVAAIPVQPIIAVPTSPASIPSLQSSEAMHQHNIVMTTAQNQMQDELQRKHEELQQLIVNQQEELRRVSEQLFYARHGILSPPLNAMPYPTTPSSTQAARCVSSTTSSVSRPMSALGVQGLSELLVPAIPSMPIVSTEVFANSMANSPVPTVAEPLQFNVMREIMPRQQPTNDTNSTQQLQQQDQQQRQQKNHQQ